MEGNNRPTGCKHSMTVYASWSTRQTVTLVDDGQHVEYGPAELIYPCDDPDKWTCSCGAEFFDLDDAKAHLREAAD